MIDPNTLTDEQTEMVEQYKKVFVKISYLEHQMSNLRAEADTLIKELETLREKDKNILENYGKK